MNGKPADSVKPPRVLLLGQGPDGHPWSAHEYMDGLRILATCLERSARVQVMIVRADSPWSEGPELIRTADGIVLYLAEGAKWLSADQARREAFEHFAARGGALTCLHWGLGSKNAQPIDAFVSLFGGCHGGPDRKYRIATVRAQLASPTHPIASGLAPFEVNDEFYYRLKFARDGALQPIVQVSIDGRPETVAWAWERRDGGRSFGFSGLHFHRNWTLSEYRRLVVQGILWTLHLPIPRAGVDVAIPERELTLRRPKPQKP